MTPLLYLRDEFANVSDTLDETLRHDYGAADSDDYYAECGHRLEAVRRRMDAISDDRDPKIADLIIALGDVANRVSLIERSHLGEFSWPFADVIRRIADRMLAERSLSRVQKVRLPIVHMIAEGTGYHVRVEKSPDPTRRKRIAIVAFPRQLRHHVLMHAIFGHELGHAAFHTGAAASICRNRVLPALNREGPLSGPDELEAWIRCPDAPEDVKRHLHEMPHARSSAGQVEQWSLELMCDLFGLLIFGTAFAAAHRTLLEPATRSTAEHELRSPTHPPLVARRRTLVDAMRVLALDTPVTLDTDGPVHEAERLLLGYVLEHDGSDWPAIFTEAQLRDALEAMKSVFAADPAIMFEKPSRENTIRLVDRLARRLPPILEEIDARGVAKQEPMPAGHCLHAGWVYWFGRDLLETDGIGLDFLRTNRLCDQALLQQRAIDLRLDAERRAAEKAKGAVEEPGVAAGRAA